MGEISGKYPTINFHLASWCYIIKRGQASLGSASPNLKAKGSIFFLQKMAPGRWAYCFVIADQSAARTLSIRPYLAWWGLKKRQIGKPVLWRKWKNNKAIIPILSGGSANNSRGKWWRVSLRRSSRIYCLCWVIANFVVQLLSKN